VSIIPSPSSGGHEQAANPDRVLVAIHQPNFFPWLGYFDKIRRVDTFVVLDNVQFPKTGGSWMNRVRIAINGAPSWLTVPVVRSFHGTRTVAETEIDDRGPWREKAIKTLRANYARAPHGREMLDVASEVLEQPTTNLAAFNLYGIRRLMRLLELDRTRLIAGTTLHSSASGTDLLVEQIREVGGSGYLCGGGADGYQEDDKFAAAGIELIYQAFQHPTYGQGTGDFIPGLSVLDALAWCGALGVRDLLARRKPAATTSQHM
jgi:hypothetical protein